MTKKQRLKFYKTLLKKVCKDPSVNSGFCYYISEISDYKITTMFDMFCYLPELYNKSPKHNGMFWFPCTYEGWEKRIALLEEVIHELQYKVETEDYL